MMPFAFLIHQDIPTSFKDMFKVTWGGGGNDKSQTAKRLTNTCHSQKIILTWEHFK